jgi:hypothetical protein
VSERGRPSRRSGVEAIIIANSTRRSVLPALAPPHL